MAWWVVQNLLIAALLAGLVQVISRAGRIGPVARHALWLIVLVKLATPPIVVLHWPWATPAPLQQTNRLWSSLSPATALGPEVPLMLVPGNDTTSAGAGLATAREITATAVTVPGAMPDALSGVWLSSAIPAPLDRLALFWIGGGVIFLLIQAIRIARIAQRVRRSAAADPALAEQVDALARQLKMGSFRLRVIEDTSSPLVWCVNPFRPQLLWPAALPADVPADCRRGLIVHELAHVKRRDHWVGWLELAAGALWWWNPLFWYVRSQVRENAELACDAWVVREQPYGRRSYAEALLAVCAATEPRRHPMPAVGVSTGTRRFLERRLVMIMRDTVPFRLSRVTFFSMAVFSMAMLPAWTEPLGAAPQRAGREASPGVVVSPRLEFPAGARRLEAPAGSPRLETAVEAPQGSRLIPVETAQRLPAEAQVLLDRFSEDQIRIRREADAQIERQRQDLLSRLQTLQDKYARTGDLDGAVAIRDRINGLRANRVVTFAGSFASNGAVSLAGSVTIEKGGSIAYPTGAAMAYRDRVGQTLPVTLRGSTAGLVWGSDVYTDDSQLAAAAVHAGILRPGEMGVVRITILPGQPHYAGAPRNGVTSLEYGSWDGSYRFEPGVTPVSQAVVDGVATAFEASRRNTTSTAYNLAEVRGLVGATMTLSVIGTTGGVWGTDVYTDDSSIGSAAVHAGILRVGERGLVKVTILPGQESYAASERNGVKSDEWGPWGGSYRLERAPQ